MIIDCHGHYTTAPRELELFRNAQLAGLAEPSRRPSGTSLAVTDDQIRDSVEKNQLKFQRERGTDLTIFSPRAAGMAHHVGDERTGKQWARLCNELIHRVCTLYPDNFVGVCQLPQVPGVSPKNCIAELERCVKESDFVGCNLNPDPVGRLVDRPAALRPLLVSALRKDGRARRAGDDPCQLVLQSELPRHRRALHERRHHGLHAVPDLGPVQGFPDLEVHHSAWRRRGALSLGPLSRTGAGHEAAAADRASA